MEIIYKPQKRLSLIPLLQLPPDLCLPHPRKYIQGMGTNVVRRLNFIYAENLVRDVNHESSGETISDEEHLFESVYSTILDAIFSEHIKEFVANQVSDPDGFGTPKFAPRLSGVAEACPGAPVKSTTTVQLVRRSSVLNCELEPVAQAPSELEEDKLLCI
ncbi:UNVERIFIED_CONTAM: hypothetical protein Slati_1643400 [Sesamum latifolium]|uniref:Uncharacterized protein n=1 Tax=Sesamum latifolium TaxID=2727402 RepID=A0AAW2XGB0_9LAMI